MKITSIPSEILKNALAELDERSLCQLRGVNKFFRTAVEQYAPKMIRKWKWQANFHKQTPRRSVIDVTEDPFCGLAQAPDGTLVSVHDDCCQGKLKQPERRLKRLRVDGKHILIVKAAISKKSAALGAKTSMFVQGSWQPVQGVFTAGEDTDRTYETNIETMDTSKGQTTLFQKSQVWFAQQFYEHCLPAPKHDLITVIMFNGQDGMFMRIMRISKGNSKKQKTVVDENNFKMMQSTKEMVNAFNRYGTRGPILVCGYKEPPHVRAWNVDPPQEIDLSNAKNWIPYDGTAPGANHPYVVVRQGFSAFGILNCETGQLRPLPDVMQRETSRDMRQVVQVNQEQLYAVALGNSGIWVWDPNAVNKEPVIIPIHPACVPARDNLVTFTCGDNVYGLILRKGGPFTAKGMELWAFDLLKHKRLWKIPYRDATADSLAIFPGAPPRIIIYRETSRKRLLLEVIEPPELL